MNFFMSYFISFIILFIIIFIYLIISKNKTKQKESNSLFKKILKNIFNFRNFIVFFISLLIIFLALFYISYTNSRINIQNSASYIFATQHIFSDEKIKEKYGEIKKIEYKGHSYYCDHSYYYINFAFKIIGSKNLGKVYIKIGQKLTPYEIFEIKYSDDIK